MTETYSWSASVAAMNALDAKVNALLPPQYQHCYEAVAQKAMGSAELRYGPDGQVAWDQIWTSFCHLALAGGPPHRGTLLEAVPVEEALADCEGFAVVAKEIGRAVRLTTELPIQTTASPGWVGVECESEAMAIWMVRAIVAENVMARRAGPVLLLPAGPRFRVAHEIKNVVVAVAKTHHYWACHIPDVQQQMPTDDLIEPATALESRGRADEYRGVVATLEREICRITGLRALAGVDGWVGLRCEHEPMAAWLLRAILVENIVSRRESTLLCLPAAPAFTPDCQIGRMMRALGQAWHLWSVFGVRRVDSSR